MPSISKETFLKAEDPKNRDAMLYDMLAEIQTGFNNCNKLKDKVDKHGNQLSFIKGIGTVISAAFSGALAWLGMK